jgi:hypothetical protein
MKFRSVPVILVLMVLVLSSLACAMSSKPITRKLAFESVKVIPTESDGSALLVDVVYNTPGAADRVYITCYYGSSSGNTTVGAGQMAVSSEFEQSSEMVFLFSVNQPGLYMAYCSSDDGGMSSSATFRVTKPDETAPEGQSPDKPSDQPADQPADQPPDQPSDQPSGQTADCNWQVAGDWIITQVNNYHPMFAITQNGTNLTGTASLPEDEATRGGYTGTDGQGEGTVNGNTFTFVVTWAPQTDGKVISGTYTGVISEGRIDGDTWYGIGPSTCVNP